MFLKCKQRHLSLGLAWSWKDWEQADGWSVILPYPTPALRSTILPFTSLARRLVTVLWYLQLCHISTTFSWGTGRLSPAISNLWRWQGLREHTAAKCSGRYKAENKNLVAFLGFFFQIKGRSEVLYIFFTEFEFTPFSTNLLKYLSFNEYPWFRDLQGFLLKVTDVLGFEEI